MEQITSLLSWMFSSITGLLVIVLIVLLTRMYVKRPSKLPPGPWGFPLLGYIPFMGKHPPKTFDKLAKKFGNIMSVQFGSHLAVILGDYPTIKKAYIDQADTFSGKPNETSDALDDRESRNIFNSDGLFWSEHRRFSVSTLRDFGIGKSSLEPAILDEISHFLDVLESNKRSAFDMLDNLSISVCNNICLLCFGKRFDYNDTAFVKLLHGIDHEMKNLPRYQPLNFVPILRKIPGIYKLLGADVVRKNIVNMYNFIDKEAQGHRKHYHDGKKNDYIDAYFTERIDREKTNNQAHMFDDVTLSSNLRLLFIAGMETTSSTLNWGILYLILHQDVQRKVQQEIDDVIGRQRSPSMDDKLRMPYTEATLMEVLRIRTIVPLGAPHRALKDTELNGYHIPKGTVIFPNLWAVHNDPKLYPDPESFRPERFINQDGKAVKPEYLIPFSIGKRQCLGEALAKMELFLYFTSMLQKFSFTNPEGAILTTDIINGATDTAKRYKVLVTVRGN